MFKFYRLLNSLSLPSSSVVFAYVALQCIIIFRPFPVFGVDIFSDEPPVDLADYATTEVTINLPTIDKTLFIEAYLKSPSQVLIITRPSKWGKTTNLRMLRRFLDIEVDEKGDLVPPEERLNRKFFCGGTTRLYSEEPIELKPRKISTMNFSMKRQGEYPVIMLNLANVCGTSYDEIEQRLRSEIEDMFTEHVFLEHYLSDESDALNSTNKRKLDSIVTGHYETEELVDSVRFLSELLFLHYKQRVHILIDDFDAPISKLFFKIYQETRKESPGLLESQLIDKTVQSPDVLKTVQLFRQLYAACLTNNGALEKALVTGTMRISKVDLFIGMHQIREYSVMDAEFSEYYGFTEEEVDTLMKDKELPPSVESNRAKIRSWYGGYNFGGSSKLMYGSWSVKQCLLAKGELAVYLPADNCPYELIDQAGNDVRKKFQDLLHGKSIIVSISKHMNFKDGIGQELFNVLLVTGNLTPRNFTGRGLYYISELVVPNLEMHHLLKKDDKPPKTDI